MTPPAPARADRGDAPVRLVAAAERLFAARGIEGVSLREITREAEQRNSTALQYHFGDRLGLVAAVLRKHVGIVAERRAALLDLLEAQEECSLRDCSRSLVTPLLASLHHDDAEGSGAAFLQIAAELMHGARRSISASSPAGPLLHDHLSSMERWAALAARFMPPETVGPPLHRRFAVIRFAHVEIGRTARAGATADLELFSAELVDLVAGLLTAPLSADTQRLLDARSAGPVTA
jgi:AcrR family transcriptional regulator